ncbi:MAG TPA: phosphoglucomutase (alpha-D-glucose-1,6-bisphosphate-dependent) [Rhodanobacteraceae bacterium]|nr:phosphoglucomutase (alpha-D-glucose-1,6-bisphosphate-dependent) [Rhodanobacteraceae bacterium]
MSEKISPLAGKPAPKSLLVDIGKLLDAYADRRPDPSVPSQRVAFGTSGHRGSSLESSFNEWHILAITQAICDFRAKEKVAGPLFLGIDTHALSQPASDTALEVLAANGVTTLIAKGGEFTPTPAISHAILVHNRGRSSGLADGIVVTPSHNPPDNGGFKYNPVNGGPADTKITGWIEQRANAYLEKKLEGVKRIPLERARRADTTREHDFLDAYVADLNNTIDFDVIRGSGLRFGVDPLGGAGVHYWAPIAERYGINLSVVSETVDPQFAFMTVDWDGKIRMDPSSKYAMQRLIGLKDRYDVAFACDTDHDRHGVVARSAGLMLPNSYLSVAIAYLFGHRPQWPRNAKLGKTVVSTSLLDRVARRTGRALYETPVGFKWFADGLFDGSLGFGCEESAGASFLRRDGSVWTTDKDGIVAALAAAEMTARAQRDPGELYQALTRELGTPLSNRVDAKATPAQKKKLSKLSRDEIRLDQIAGEKIERVLDRAPGNDAPIGGIKVVAKSGWFAARPSGTEAIYKIYAESFRDEEHLQALLSEAQDVVDKAIA